LFIAFHRRNLPFLKRIGRRGLIRQKSIRIRRTSNRIRSFGATRRRYNLGDIHGLGLYAKLEKKRYITRITYSLSTGRRLDRCFKGR
jgi:hypothetical protein